MSNERKLTIGTLCSGIGGIDLGFERAGFEVKFMVEIDRACRNVLRRHFPNALLREDMTECCAANLPRVDVLAGGFPCQDLSVAGQRAGLAGKRSGLWWHLLRVCNELQPDVFVWENVLGLLSSNEGKDIVSILRSTEDVGYITNLEILDSQEFGVAQRRERVFGVCLRVNSLLKQRTHSSGHIGAQCLTEILRHVLAALSNQSAAEGASSACRERAVDGLTRKTKLFGSTIAKSDYRLLLDFWAGISANYPSACPNSGLGAGGVAEQPRVVTSSLTAITEDRPAGSTQPRWSIKSSWSECLDGLSALLSEYITSTGSKTITPQETCICFRLLQHIAERTLQLNCSCPTFYGLAQSVLTAVEEFTNYARQESESLFSSSEHLLAIADVAHNLAGLRASLGNIDTECFGEILPLSKSVCWNYPTREAAREGVAGTLAASLRTGFSPNGHGHSHGLRGDGSDNLIPVPEVAWALQERDSKGSDSSTKDGHLIPCRIQEPIPIQEIGKRQSGNSMNGVGHGQPGDPMFTLQSTAQHGVCCFQSKDSGESAGDIAPTLRALNFDKSHMNGGGQLAVAFKPSHFTRGKDGAPSELAPPLSADADKGDQEPVVAYDVIAQNGSDIQSELNAQTVGTIGAGQSKQTSGDVIAYRTSGNCGVMEQGDKAAALNTATDPNQNIVAFQPRIARNGRGQPEPIVPALSGADAGATSDMRPCIASRTMVRRLTPVECERLQAHPDGYTAWGIDEKGQRVEQSDSARYRQLGNGVTANVLEWIARRIITTGSSAAEGRK